MAYIPKSIQLTNVVHGAQLLETNKHNVFFLTASSRIVEEPHTLAMREFVRRFDNWEYPELIDQHIVDVDRQIKALAASVMNNTPPSAWWVAMVDNTISGSTKE